MKINIKYDSKINKNAFNKIEDDIYRSLQLGAEYLLTEALKTTPKEDGTLRASGKVSGNRLSVETAVSFDTPYAVRLHEHPEYNFQGNGRGKWLELTLNEEQDQIIKLISKTLEAELNKGGGI
jgi:hypothetical protein